MNKGFTLIEVLASVIIIGLILVITIPSYMYVYNTVKDTNYRNKVNVIKQRAVDYGETVKDEIQALSRKNKCQDVLISDLIKKGYIKSDYTNKDALTNPKSNQEFEENLSLCYCKSDNTVKAFMVNTFDPSKAYTKGEQVKKNNTIYECMSSYSYNEIMNDRNAYKNKKNESRDTEGNVIYVDAPCKGYYNGEIDVCITNSVTVNDEFLINTFFKRVEC